MRRIFGAYAYGAGPRTNCWWDETCGLPRVPAISGPETADVAVIGGGFTGLSAAHALARAGVDVVLLEAMEIGWGASGRNGGFCCLGGAVAEDAELDARYGKAARLTFRAAEVAAVAHVEHFVDTHALVVDRHSKGETELAHRPGEMVSLRARVTQIQENYGVTPSLIEQDQLAAHGFGGGPFYGALTIPVGFGLNPRKYHAGLLTEVRAEGVRIFAGSPVERVASTSRGHVLHCAKGKVTASDVVIATNAYSSENVPDWLAGRYMPAQSNVLVTRPMTEQELEAQGWTTPQMSYDTRNLLHYFRLMPDRRFLFGMRGGLTSGAAAEAASRRRIRRDFERMFPAWQHVDVTHMWSGMVSLARDKIPFVGAIPHANGLWTAMCYHGNGVAMGSYAGRLIADQVLGHDAENCPQIMRKPLARFPLGSGRRALMPPVYAKLMLGDRF
ncbi:MAG: FAD-dependent oxidoreductase [Pseudomonadota bacterium]